MTQKNIGNAYYLHEAFGVNTEHIFELPNSNPATFAIQVLTGTATVYLTISEPNSITPIWVPAEGVGAGGVIGVGLKMVDIPTPITAIRVLTDIDGSVIAELKQGE